MYWTKEETNLLTANFFGNTYKELSVLLNRSEGSVRGKSERLGLKKKENKLWTGVEKKFLSKNYGELPPIKIAIALNRTVTSVGLKAYYMGLTNKYDYGYHIPSYNEDFFCNWTKELAWLVGIVLSDGHVSNIKLNSKFIRIHMCDKDVIYKIKKITDYRSSIGKHVPTNHYKPSYTITFCGKLVWDFFTGLGMDSNKSINAKFPTTVPNDLISHTMRGLFDGDGSVSINKGKYINSRICGTEEVINAVKDYIGLHHTIHANKLKTNFIIQYIGDRAITFLDYLYNDSSKDIRMDRKYNIYTKYINSI